MGSAASCCVTAKCITSSLLIARNKSGDDVALVRVEQFYPLPEQQLRAAVDGFPPDVPVFWVQEEPENLGAWTFWKRHYGAQLYGRPLATVSRPESASPATGSSAAHRHEQKELIERAFRATT